MIDLGLDREGSYEVILEHLPNATKNRLSMALTGYRSGPSARALLEDLNRVLAEWPIEQSAVCGPIHDGEKENN